MNKKNIWAIFLLILAAAFMMRLAGLDRSFLLDEFRTIKIASLPMREMFEHLQAESYPPFSFLALSAWMKAMRTDIWIRFLFVLFGMLSVITAYLIGRELVDDRYGIIAMFLCALMPIQVWTSQYVRGIAPSIFFILVSTLFFFRLLKAAGGKKYLWNVSGYIAGSILAAYSFYFAFFVLLIQNIVYIVYNRRDAGNLFRWFLIQAALAVLFIPWLHGFFVQLQQGNIAMNFSMVYGPGMSVGALQIGSYVRGAAGLLGLDQSFLMNTAVTKWLPGYAAYLIMAASILILAFLTHAFISFYRKTPRPAETAFFLACAISPLAVSIILNALFKTPIATRYFAVSSAFLIFIYAFMLYSIKKKPLLYCVMGLFIMVSLIRLSDFTKPDIDYKAASNFIDKNIRENECLLFIEGDAAYSFYNPLPKNYIGSRRYIAATPSSGYENLLEDIVSSRALRLYIKPFRTVWIYNNGERLTGIIQHVLKLLEGYGYKEADRRKFRNMEIFKYERSA